jgi:hypothetical protein
MFYSSGVGRERKRKVQEEGQTQEREGGGERIIARANRNPKRDPSSFIGSHFATVVPNI